MLKGKKIVLGVTGGIAVYKAVDLVSKLRKQGAEVRVVMTDHAQQFVTPLTFKEISGNKVAVSMWNANAACGTFTGYCVPCHEYAYV